MNPSQTLNAMNSSTHCRICGQRWIRVKTSLLLSDQAKNEELARLLQEILAHIQNAHPEVIKSITLAVQEFSGCMMMANFATDDGRLDQEIDRYLQNVKRTISTLEQSRRGPTSAIAAKRG
jgi:hypothetical protein